MVEGLNTSSDPAALLSVSVSVAADASDGTTAGGSTAERPRFLPITVVRRIDRFSPKLMEAAASGRHFTAASIEIFGEAGGTPGPGGTTPILIWRLTDVVVTAYGFSTSTNEPTDRVSLSFTNVCSIFRRLDDQGEVISTATECSDVD